MNLDRNKLFPDQRNPADHDENQCVGLSIADILGNYYGDTFDPDFPYSLGFYMRGYTPADTGVEPYASIVGTVAHGIIPVSLETWTAKTTSELYAANFRNFDASQDAGALAYAPPGWVSFENYEDIATWLSERPIGVSLAVQWYESFNTPNADGTLPMPQPNEPYSYHNVAVYGVDPVKGLLVKPWEGAAYGAGGYAYMSKAVFLQCFDEAYSFDFSASRKISLLLIMIWQLQYLLSILQSRYGSKSLPSTSQ